MKPGSKIPLAETPADSAPVPPNRKGGFFRSFDPSLPLSLVCTAAFYGVVLQPSMRGSVLYHYTTEHNVEYAIVAMFIWGLVDMFLKIMDFPREFWSLRQDWLPPRRGPVPVATANLLLDQLGSKPRAQQETHLGKRLAEGLQYVIDNGSAKEYREHLQYLSEQDLDNTHASYMLGRFVITVTPVLGFLGTVVHFGTALTGISFDEMTQRLPVIVGEMGTAFNTTTVALTAAMTLMFCVFLCEKIERGIVRKVDRIVDRELLGRFEVKDPSLTPFLGALQSASEETLRAISGTLNRQIDVWTQSLDALFQRFDKRHEQQSLAWQGALDQMQQRTSIYDSEREEWLKKSVSVLESRQDEHMAQIQRALEEALTYRGEFAQLAKTLENLSQGEGRLVALQSALAENLRVLHETQQLDEAVHGLTAAIHLLTARNRQSGSFGSAAA